MDEWGSDQVLLEVFREHTSIPAFLNAVFGFLHRHTDFYQTNNDKKLGIDEGEQQRLVISTMQRYSKEYRHLRLVSNDETPSALTEIEVITGADTVESDAVIAYDHERPYVERCERDFFAPTDYKNGLLRDDYCWSQTLKDVEVHVRLPPDMRNSKMVAIEITNNSISVQRRRQPDSVIFAGILSNKCKTSEAVWTISDQQKLTISFDKAREIWWEKLFEHDDDTTDIKKLDTDCYIDELPDESQAAIHKLRVQQMENSSHSFS